eukprot:2301300-Amphidinium_carterae.1
MMVVLRLACAGARQAVVATSFTISNLELSKALPGACCLAAASSLLIQHSKLAQYRPPNPQISKISTQNQARKHLKNTSKLKL